MADLPEGFVLDTPASAPAAAAPGALPPEGFTMDAPRAPTHEELATNAQDMLKQGKPFDDVKKYLNDNGLTIDPQTEKWYQTEYPKLLKQKGFDPSRVQWVVNTPAEPHIGSNESQWEGLKSAALMGFGDELSGAAGAVGNEIGSALGLNNSNASFGERYQRITDAARRRRDAAYEANPAAYASGFVPGVMISGGLGGERVAATKLPGWLQAMILGGAQGAVSGAGNADTGDGENVLNRLTPALVSGVEGAALGPVVNAVGQGLAKGARGVYERLFAPAEQSGLRTLQDRAPEVQPSQMRDEAAQMRNAGVQPRLVDVVGPEGRAVVRTAAEAPTPARPLVAKAAAETAAAVPERVAAQASIISPSKMTARQMSSRIAEEQKGMGAQFDQVRNEPVQLTPQVVQALSTDEGMATLRTIGRYMTPDEKEPLKQLMSALVKAKTTPTAAQQAEKLVPGFAKMSEQAQQQVLSQLPDIKDPLAGVNFTVDMADKFARIMTDRAGDNPGMMRVAKDYAEVLRGAARAQHPAYDEALKQYAARAGVADAAAGTGRAEDTNFLSTPADQFVEGRAKASDTPAAIIKSIPKARGSVSLTENSNAPGLTDGVYTAENGAQVPFKMSVTKNGLAHIDVGSVSKPFDHGSSNESANALGPAVVRDAQRAIIEQRPDIKEFAGIRVTGARKDSLDTQFVPAETPKPTVSERDAMAARHRDEVVDRANQGTQPALTVAKQIANSPEQHARNVAALGGRAADRLEQGMGAEVKRAQNMQDVDPTTGNSRMRGKDAVVDGFANAVSHAAGGKWHIVRAAARWLKQGGIRNVDAERLARDAISDDPAKVDGAIAYLERRGMERERAARFIRTMASSLAARAAPSPDSGQPGPPVPSVRAIMRQPQGESK